MPNNVHARASHTHTGNRFTSNFTTAFVKFAGVAADNIDLRAAAGSTIITSRIMFTSSAVADVIKEALESEPGSIFSTLNEFDVAVWGVPAVSGVVLRDPNSSSSGDSGGGSGEEGITLMMIIPSVIAATLFLIIGSIGAWHLYCRDGKSPSFCCCIDDAKEKVESKTSRNVSVVVTEYAKTSRTDKARLSGAYGRPRVESLGGGRPKVSSGAHDPPRVTRLHSRQGSRTLTGSELSMRVGGHRRAVSSNIQGRESRSKSRGKLKRIRSSGNLNDDVSGFSTGIRLPAGAKLVLNSNANATESMNLDNENTHQAPQNSEMRLGGESLKKLAAQGSHHSFESQQLQMSAADNDNEVYNARTATLTSAIDTGTEAEMAKPFIAPEPRGINRKRDTNNHTASQSASASAVELSNLNSSTTSAPKPKPKPKPKLQRKQRSRRQSL